MKCQCGKEIYFLVTSAGRRMPVNAESMSDEEVKACELSSPVPYDRERHISHFSDCPLSAWFRKAYRQAKGSADGKVSASRLPEQG